MARARCCSSVPGRVVIFDDDHSYLGPVIAEALVKSGAKVSCVSTETCVCAWGACTNEKFTSQRRLIELGVDLVFGAAVDGLTDGAVATSCIYTGRPKVLAADALVLVTSRGPDTALSQICHQPRVVPPAASA